MANVTARLEIKPETVGKLSPGKLWSAAHDDGSKNRINSDAVWEAAGYHTLFALLAAGFMGLRKKFRNRGKTREDLAAEKEAAKINRTSGALEEMLLEYFRSAQDGTVDEKSLDELIDTLGEIQGYYQSGKLTVPGKTELAEMRGSIEAFTAALAESAPEPAARKAEAAGQDDFCRIRDCLIRQKELIHALS